MWLNKSVTTINVTFQLLVKYRYVVFFFREFQPMTSASDDSSLLSDQDIN